MTLKLKDFLNKTLTTVNIFNLFIEYFIKHKNRFFSRKINRKNQYQQNNKLHLKKIYRESSNNLNVQRT